MDAESTQTTVRDWRFRAFLSYSRRDDRIARWLHSQLEAYRMPADLVAAGGTRGAVPKRLSPVFRDRTDLSSGGELGSKLVEALTDAEFLIVLCSTASAQSRHVNAEVQTFIDQGRTLNILPVIVSGEPNSADPEHECLPPAIRNLELLAADFRSFKHKDGHRIGDGRESGKFKLIAGMLGVSLDALLQRERKREARRAAFSALASVVFLGLAVTAAGAAYVAYQNELEARRQTAAAQASADFLVSTFEVAIPAQDNPDSITARTILDRGMRRVHNDFEQQPHVRARLADAMARAYSQLGLLENARNVVESDLPSIRQTGADGVQALLTLALVYRQQGDFNHAMELVSQAEHQLRAQRRDRPDLLGYVFETRGILNADLLNTEEALLWYSRASDEYGRVRPQNVLDDARVLTNRAAILTAIGRYDAAERSLLEANAQFALASGQRSLNFGKNLFALAINAYYAGRQDAANNYLVEAQEIFEAVLDPLNPALGDVYTLRGQLEADALKLDEAEENLERALQIYSAAFEGRNLSTASALYALAFVHHGRGANELALLTLDEVKLHYDSAYDESHPNQGDLLVQRAVMLHALGRSAEAVSACRNGLATIAATLGADSEMYIEDRAQCSAILVEDARR